MGCGRLGYRLRLRFGRARACGGLALLRHIDAAAEVRTFGNGHAGRRDVAVDRPVLTDIDLFAGTDVAHDLAQDDDRLGEQLGFDLAIWTDRQHVVAEFDLPLDMPFDGQIFAPVQLTLDDDGFADVHHVPRILAPHGLWTDGLRRCCWSRRSCFVRRHRRLRRLRRLSHCFVTLPHFVILPDRFRDMTGDPEHATPGREWVRQYRGPYLTCLALILLWVSAKRPCANIPNSTCAFTSITTRRPRLIRRPQMP